MGREWDVVVVGDGLAGRVAALAAADSGASVRLVAEAEDASRHGPGVIDVLGYAPGADAPTAEPLEAVDALPAGHPYERLGAETVRTAMAFLDRHLGDSYVGLDDPRNALFAGPLGNPLVAYGYPRSVAAGRFGRGADARPGQGARGREERVLLVDVVPLSDFDAGMAVRRLRAADVPVHVDAATVDLSDVLEPDADRLRVADRLDREAGMEPADRPLSRSLAEAVRSVVRDHDRVGIPALLGVERWPAVYRRLDAHLEPDVFEVPTGPPSVLGLRLDRALDAAVGATRVVRTRGVRAVAHRDADGVVAAVGVGRESSTEWVAGRQFVLATGGLIGGGLRATGARVEEPLFDCPVASNASGEWTAPDPFDAQPFASAGLSVDDRLRPVGTSADPVYANLRAAGDVLGHFDAVREASGAGVAVATGYAAGRAAAREAES